MSTKVYNFYRYTGGDMPQLLIWLKQLRTGYMEHTKTTLRQFGLSTEQLIRRMEGDTKAGCRPPFNIDASACVYLHDGQIYVHFFAGQVFLRGLVESADMLIDCHYQNQSDQPDDISDEEWDQRRELVEAIGILDVPPSRVGLIFVFADESDIIDLALEAGKRVEQRCRQCHKSDLPLNQEGGLCMRCVIDNKQVVNLTGALSELNDGE